MASTFWQGEEALENMERMLFSSLRGRRPHMPQFGFPQTQTLKPEFRGKPFIWDLKVMRGVEMSEGREGSRKAG